MEDQPGLTQQEFEFWIDHATFFHPLCLESIFSSLLIERCTKDFFSCIELFCTNAIEEQYMEESVCSKCARLAVSITQNIKTGFVN